MKFKKILFVFLLIGTLLSIPFFNIKVYANSNSILTDTTQNLLEEKMKSKTFIYNNKEYHINDGNGYPSYFNNLYGNRDGIKHVEVDDEKFLGIMSTGEAEIEFKITDPITSLIPIQVFEELSSKDILYTYMGEKWGVIIDSFLDRYGVRLFTVQVIETIINNTIKENEFIKVKIQPIFETQYVWLESGEGQVNLPRHESYDYELAYMTGNYERTGPIGLYALPSATIEPNFYTDTIDYDYYFDMSKRTYINNFAFSGILSNEQEPNEGHTDYDSTDDYGAYFVGSDINFSAFEIDDLINPKQRIEGEPTALELITTFIGLIPELPYIVDVAVFTYDIITMAKEYNVIDLPPDHYYRSTSNAFTQYYFSSHSLQIDNYGYLIKDCVTLLENKDYALSLFGSQDSYAEGIYRISQQKRPIGENQYEDYYWSSRLDLNIQFDVHRYDPDDDFVQTVSWHGKEMIDYGIDSYKTIEPQIINNQFNFNLDSSIDLYNYYQNTSYYKINYPSGFYKISYDETLYDFNFIENTPKYYSEYDAYYLDGNIFYQMKFHYKYDNISQSSFKIDLIRIADYAFENYNNIEEIIIPYTVKSISKDAFVNCTNLKVINIKNLNSIIDIDLLNIEGCLSLESILVPSLLYSKYINDEKWLNYIEFIKCESVEFEYNFELYCRMTKINEQLDFFSTKRKIIELDIGCPIQYDIRIKSSEKFELLIYDSNMELIDNGSFIISNDNYIIFSCPLFELGKAYIEINSDNYVNNNIISIEIDAHTSTIQHISTYDEVNVLTHLHENKNEFIISPSKSGLFLLELFAIVNGEYVNPRGEFIIKNSNNEIVQKMSLSDYNHSAISIENANNIMFYANKWGGYTIYLEVDDLVYDELTLKVNEIEDFTVYDMDENDKYINNNVMQIGDFAYIYNLERIGTYNISFKYQGIQSNEMLFVLFETNEQGEYIYKDSYEINNSNNSIELVEVLIYSKNLLLCVFDSEGLGNLNIDISKELNNEFTIYGASAPSSSIIYLTKGFQEICYLGADAPNRTSRYTYYNWYSTDESVIVVSAYGTVTAVGVGEAKVQCVYKADTSIIATLDFEVVDDPLDNGDEANDIYLTYGFDVRTGGTIAGTEVTSGKGDAISVASNPYVSIHVTYTRLICLGSDSPNSSVQAFNWRAYREYDTDTGMVNVSQFGTITGTTTGWVTIEGTYKYNSRYKVKIRIYVESNI